MCVCVCVCVCTCVRARACVHVCMYCTYVCIRGSQTVGLPRGARIVSMRDIYFERNMGARQNMYFGRQFAWLKYFTYHLVVPVLAPNYK
jgi:hypothetical protein